MNMVMPSSDEDSDGDDDSRYSRRFSFFEKMMNLDREIILFAVLLTSYAAVRNINQTASKSSEPKPFFPETPWLNDFYHGEIHKAFSLASKEDITFVMYYAPWDADCQRAKPIFEKVARYYHKQIHFMAINCWDPLSVCKAHFSKIKKYPVFMAYLQRNKGVEYQGLVDFGHMTHFLSSLIVPLHRIQDLQTLNKLRSTYDAVVVAYTPFYGMFGGDHYQVYYRASLKFLEVDPRRDVAFAVITDQTAAEDTRFQQASHPSANPAIRLYLWNTTLVFERKWDPSEIVRWIHETTHKIATWVYPPGIKSNLLAQFIDTGPTLILFTPQNMFLSHSYEYNLLKIAALHFYDCNPGENNKDFYTTMHLISSYISLDDQWESIKALKYECCSGMLKREPEVLSKSFKGAIGSQKYCSLFDHENSSRNKSFYNTCKDTLSSPFSSRSWQLNHPKFDDELSSESLIRSKLKNDCRKLRFAQKYLPEDWFDNKKFHTLRRQLGTSARSLGCKGNTTLSFLAMNSLHFDHFASNLGVNLKDKYAETAVFIIDSKAESIFHLNSTYVSLELLEQFIFNFTRGNLARLLRSSNESPRTKEDSHNSLIDTISSKTFSDLVTNSHKTVLVYFYSPFCTYSQSVYYVYLSLANTLKSLNKYISFVRMDGENNDLEWPFSIDKYPSIIMFPSADKSNSKLFNRKSKLTISNLSKFILLNLSFELRVQAHVLFCLNRIFSDFHSIESCISNFKLSSMYFINYYNTELRNILIHHKLQNDAFLNITSGGSKSTKQKNYLVLNKNENAEATENLLASVKKVKCKLLYFQLVNSYLNNLNFTNVDLDSVSSSVLSFYKIYLSDSCDNRSSNSVSCGELISTLKKLQKDISFEQDTVANFQEATIQYRNTFSSILCHLRKNRACKCASLKHFTNADDISLEEPSDIVTNEYSTANTKEDETSLPEKVTENVQVSSNEILRSSPEDSHEEQSSREHVMSDEL